MSNTNTGPSRRTLDELPEKVTRFLAAIKKNRSIRRTLFAHGLNQELRRKAWLLLQKIVGVSDDNLSPDPEAAEDKEIREIISFLDQLDERLFRLLIAILEFNHPDQLAYLLHGDLKPGTGMAAVLGLDKLVSRIEAMRDGTDATRADKRDADEAALATLAARGYGEAFWQDLRKKIDRVSKEIEDPEAEPAPDPAADQRDAALIELYQWYKEWSTIAREFIKRRDQLISLGLARRRKRKEENNEEIGEDDDEENDDPTSF